MSKIEAIFWVIGASTFIASAFMFFFVRLVDVGKDAYIRMAKATIGITIGAGILYGIMSVIKLIINVT